MKFSRMKFNKKKEKSELFPRRLHHTIHRLYCAMSFRAKKEIMEHKLRLVAAAGNTIVTQSVIYSLNCTDKHH